MRSRLLLLALLSTGCGAAVPSPLPLSWRFSDGRACTDSGVETVVVRNGGSVLGQFDCAAGSAPAAVEVAAAPGWLLQLEGESPPGAPLYVGDLAVGAVASAVPATITLYPRASR